MEKGETSSKNHSKGEQEMSCLSGKFQNTMDNNGRIIFPADFRKEMGSKIILAKGFFEHCLCAYTEEEWKVVCDNLKKYPEAKIGKVRMWIFGSACTLVPDKQGRVFIPKELADHAFLKHDVTFIGADSRVELWDSETYNKAYSDIKFEDIADILTELQF